MRQVAISSQFSIFVWIPPGPLVGVGSPGPPTLFCDVGVMAPELDTTRAFVASLSSLLDPEDEGLAMLPREVFTMVARTHSACALA